MHCERREEDYKEEDNRSAGLYSIAVIILTSPKKSLSILLIINKLILYEFYI